MNAMLVICLVTLLSDLTPGPNFWKIVNHSINDSRSKSLVFVSGLISGSLIHCLLGFIGVSAFIASFEYGLTIIQVCGGLYISWYGYQLFISKHDGMVENESETKGEFRKTWLDGVLTNLANPKTILFYASLFGVVLNPEMSALQSFGLVLAILVTSVVTNSSIACLFSIQAIRSLFNKIKGVFSKCVGVMLFIGGLNIVFQKR